MRFVVAWKPKNAPKNEEERAVPLVDLLLKYEPQVENTKDCPLVESVEQEVDVHGEEFFA